MFHPFKAVQRSVSRTKTMPFALPVALLLGCATLLNFVNLTPVSAQNAAGKVAKEPIEIELQAFKVVRNDEGKEQFQTAQNMKPGDILEYRAVYTNVSQKEVKNLQANLPIPTTTELLLNTVAPKAVNASLDGRTFSPAPLMRAVKMPNGTTKNRAVPQSLYRTLRWPVGTIAPGQNVTVRARVRLNKTFSSE